MPKQHKNVLTWQNLLPGVVEKLISPNLCRGMESKEAIKYLSVQETKKIVPGIIEKLVSSNPLQGLGMQRTSRKVFKPNKH